MARERIITALDLGSHKIKVATLLIGHDGDLKIIGYGESWARGVRRGQLIDGREAADSIKEAVAAASKTGNVKISRIVVGLGGPHFKLMNSRGSIAVSRADGEISADDVGRVLDAARAVSISSNREIVHTIPLVYTVDGEEKIKDPVGMRGVRLEAEVMLVLGLSPVLRSVRKAVGEAGLELEKVIYSPLAVSRAVLTKKQRELGAATVDIGATTTSVCVWEESDLKYVSVVPVGSGKITDDVALGLRISPELSEKIKTEHGCSMAAGVSRREQVVLADWSPESAVVPKWELARIIEARASEILEMVQEELKKSGRANLLPAGAILVGGGARLAGLAELARKKLKLPVELGRVREVKTDFSEIFTTEAATLTGLLLCEYDDEEKNQGERAPSVSSETIGGLWHKIKGWLADLVP